MRRGDVRTACGFMLLLGLIALGITNDFDRNHWAAWVQAVGSVIAIAFSVWISHDQWSKQQRVEKMRAAEDLARITQFANAVIQTAINAIGEVRRYQMKTPAGTNYFFQQGPEMKASGAMLQTLLTHPLPSKVAQAATLTWAAHSKVETAALALYAQANFRANSRFHLFWSGLDTEIETISDLIGTALATANSDPALNL